MMTKTPYLIIILLLASCAEQTQNPLVDKHCTKDYLDGFSLENWGVDTSNKALLECDYKSLGYGGSYELNATFEDLKVKTYWSGMGSGGHDHTHICVASRDEDIIKEAERNLCATMKHLYHGEDHTCTNTTTYDISPAIRRACEEGLFTITQDGESVLSYNHSTNRCGESISIGTYDCTTITPTQDREERLNTIIAEALKETTSP